MFINSFYFTIPYNRFAGTKDEEQDVCSYRLFVESRNFYIAIYIFHHGDVLQRSERT